MDWEAIINKLFLQVDDSSQLSTEEALDLVNDIYTDVQNDRDWEWLKSIFAGSTSTSVPYITLPSDFKKVSTNYSEQSFRLYGNAGVPVGYIGSTYLPSNVGNLSFVFVNSQAYQVIPFSSRMNYENMDGFCYIYDGKLYFTLQPTQVLPVTFDYIKIAPALELNTEPLFRSAFHKVLAYGGAIQFPILEQADKSMSYMRENQFLYDKALQSMQIEDANIKLSL